MKYENIINKIIYIDITMLKQSLIKIMDLNIQNKKLRYPDSILTDSNPDQGPFIYPNFWSRFGSVSERIRISDNNPSLLTVTFLLYFLFLGSNHIFALHSLKCCKDIKTTRNCFC